MKGLICAGGSATRLQELTRVTNKHLLPVGRWPMVYYPLQLLERLGVRDILLVTGQQHAGDFIDLLGDGRVRARSGASPCSTSTSPTRCRSSPVGSHRSSEWPATSPRDDKLVVCLGDNIFEYAQTDALALVGDAGALVFVKEVPDPERFGVVAYDEDGGSWTSSRRPASSTRAIPAADGRCGGRSLRLPAGRVRDHPRARAL